MKAVVLVGVGDLRLEDVPDPVIEERLRPSEPCPFVGAERLGQHAELHLHRAQHLGGLVVELA